MVRNLSGRCPGGKKGNTLMLLNSVLLPANNRAILSFDYHITDIVTFFCPFSCFLRMISSPWVFTPLATHMASLKTSSTHFLSRSR